ncbi:arylamine N-acetyltransferase 4 [Acrodontium crateriforme]|uniref:Arylamine N-acetyltransferase 4 n=1 Tax=Acrodontium crateriforme TaxID=150365 RepID=A0AAQ3M9V8_9PEZI|nr:arylamine N-acetyltransferase 4 [Acrodontium crateriforme]
MSPPAVLSPYSKEQVNRFLSFIDLPAKYHPGNDHPRDLAFLSSLHTHMISTIPYENLSLHYSNERNISLEPEDLYRKFIIDGRGKGGYCMEDSLFYMHMLRALGFQTYTPGVRIRRRTNGVPQGGYTGWVHLVNIVTLDDGTRWMVDIGFGGDGATKPMPMITGHVLPNIGTQEIRLIHDHIDEQSVRTDESRLWIYQYRNGLELEWNSFYAFPDIEFLHNDFRVVNWFTSANPISPQLADVLVVKFLRRKNTDAPSDEEIYGKRMLVNGTIKENLGGKTKVLFECKTEAERIQALHEYFGITLTDEQRTSIRGWKTALALSENDSFA